MQQKQRNPDNGPMENIDVLESRLLFIGTVVACKMECHKKLVCLHVPGGWQGCICAFSCSLLKA